MFIMTWGTKGSWHERGRGSLRRRKILWYLRNQGGRRMHPAKGENGKVPGNSGEADVGSKASRSWRRSRMMDIFSQIWIAAFGCSAVWLVGRLDGWKKYGYLCGLIGQPAWFYTAWHNEQWGILALSFWYAYSWGQGFYNYWMRG